MQKDYSAIRNIDSTLLANWPLPTLDSTVDKSERGNVLLIAGSRELAGAAALAANSVLRAGAGKVTIITSASASCLLTIVLPEARVIGLPDREDGGLLASPTMLMGLDRCHFDVLLAGPGLQNSSASRTLVMQVLSLIDCKDVILDAEAIGLSKDVADMHYRVLLTPHAGEMAHLRRVPKDQVNAQPLATAQATASDVNAIVILKGADTYISNPEGHDYIHTGGHAGLAVSGSGDCLAGIIAGLAARGAPLEQAAAWAVFIHGAAGLVLAKRNAGIGFLASEIPAEIPRLINTQSSNDVQSVAD